MLIHLKNTVMLLLRSKFLLYKIIFKLDSCSSRFFDELARGEIANDEFDGFRVELSIMCMISTIDRFDGSKRKF